jgi:hypothetical protein
VQFRGAFAVEAHELVEWNIELAKQHAVACIAVDERAEVGEELVQTGLVARVDRQLSQNFIASSIAARTAGSRQFRSGCEFKNVCR